MKILGLHSAIGWNGNHADDMSRVHASGATLFVDGKHIRSIDESRLTRNKQEGNYPELHFCRDLGIALDDSLGGTNKVNSSSDFLANWKYKPTKRDWGLYEILSD